MDKEIEALERFLFNPDRRLTAFPAGCEQHFYFSLLARIDACDFPGALQVAEAFSTAFPESTLLRTAQIRSLLAQYDCSDPETQKELLQRLNHTCLKATCEFTPPMARQDAATPFPSRLDYSLLEIDRNRAEQEAHYFRLLTPEEIRGLDLHKMSEEVFTVFLKRASLHQFPQLPSVLASRLSGATVPTQLLKRLTLPQLQELAALKPLLMEDEAVVQRLFSMQFQVSNGSARASIDILQKALRWCESLPPKFHLYQEDLLLAMLHHYQSLGEYPGDLFLKYLAVHHPDGLFTTTESRQCWARLYIAEIDESLVRDAYLERFLTGDEQLALYSPFLASWYLRRALHRSKLLRGVDPAECELPPDELQSVRSQVLIDLAPNNPSTFTRTSEVTLTVSLKNAGKLIVRTVELDALGYCLAHADTTPEKLPLAGVESATTVYDFSGYSPFVKHEKTISFPEITHKSGLFILEFIGNGLCARALIRKGSLKLISKLTPAGHQMTVLDEENRICANAKVFVDERCYELTEDRKSVIVPFAGKDKLNFAVISDGHVAERVSFTHRKESYALHTSFFLHEESFLSHALAAVTVRPLLTVCDLPAPSTLMRKPLVTVETTDFEGFAHTKHYASVDPRDDITVEFEVPVKVVKVTVTFECEVATVTGQTVHLRGEHRLKVNENLRKKDCKQLFLRQLEGEFYLQLLGSNGEVLSKTPVAVTLRKESQRDFPKVLLATDESGLVALGQCEGVVSVSAALAQDEGNCSNWNLSALRPAVQYPKAMFLCEGDQFSLPFLRKTEGQLELWEAELLALTGAGIVSAERLEYDPERASLSLSGLKPGKYQLILHSSVTIAITVFAGVHWGDHQFVITDNTVAQTGNQYRSLAVRSITREGNDVVIQLCGDWDHAKAYITFHSFQSQRAFTTYSSVAAHTGRSGTELRIPEVNSKYFPSESVDSEYRYVLERSLEERFTGTTLPKPQLLLRPVEVQPAPDRDSEDDDYACECCGADCDDEEASSGSENWDQPAKAIEQSPGMDFLGAPAALITAVADSHGVIRVPASADHSSVSVVVTNGEFAASASASIGGLALRTKDLAQQSPFDPSKNYAEVRKCVVLRGSESLGVAGNVQLIDTVEKLGRVLVQVSKSTGAPLEVSEWDFLLSWANLSEVEKNEKYDKYCSHELNLFLYLKDRGYFDTVVRPFLSSKMEKQVVDRFLLGESLFDYLSLHYLSRLNYLEKVLLVHSVKGESGVVQSMVQQRDANKRHTKLFDAVMRAEVVGSKDSEVGSSDSGEEESGRGGSAVRGDFIGIDSDDSEEGEGGGGGEEDDCEEEEKGPTRPPRMKEQKESLRHIQEEMAEVSDCFGSVSQLCQDQGELLLLGDDEILEEREAQRPYFQQMDSTKEYAETHYYGPADRLQISAFWCELAASAYQGTLRMLSDALLTATDGVTSYICALACCDLPFVAAKHGFQASGGGVTLKAASPAIVYHMAIVEAALTASALMCTQRYFLPAARFSVNPATGETEERPVTTFAPGQVYGCEVIVSNASVTSVSVAVLAQIPQGALPIGGCDYSKAHSIDLSAYETKTLEHYFYFPREGSFLHAAVYVSVDGEVVARSEHCELTVSAQVALSPSASFAEVAASGDIDLVLSYIQRRNPYSQEIADHITTICYLLNDANNFRKTVTLLRNLQFFDARIWAFGIVHNDAQAISELITSNREIIAQIGHHFHSKLAVTAAEYRHLDYQPMVNSRVHRKGIENASFRETYKRTLFSLGHKARLTNTDYLVLVQYLIYQDRIPEAKGLLQFISMKPSETTPGTDPLQLQYDYITAYLYPEVAANIAKLYSNNPIPAWKLLFAAVTEQWEEASNTIEVEESLDATVTSGTVVITYSHLRKCVIRLYAVDVEVLFSRNPFFMSDTALFTYVLPNEEMDVELDGEGRKEVVLGEKWSRASAVVELEYHGKKLFRPSFSSGLTLVLMEQFGYLQVLDHSGKGLPRVYIKVYWQSGSTGAQFYKDGYTDIRGKFDYASLSTPTLEVVESFAILAVDDRLGATISTAKPPAR